MLSTPCWKPSVALKPSVIGIHDDADAFQRYAPPTSVRAYSKSLVPGWKTRPVTYPPPPYFTLDQEFPWVTEAAADAAPSPAAFDAVTTK